jgi:hypothetical protein
MTMLHTPAYILLTLYSAIIVVSYLTVRRGWLRAHPTFVIGGIANALVAFAFSLMRGNMFLQAVIVGPITGILFVAVSVTMASLFRDTIGQPHDDRLALLSRTATDHSYALPELSSSLPGDNNTSNTFAAQRIFAEPELGELIALPN